MKNGPSTSVPPGSGKADPGGKRSKRKQPMRAPGRARVEQVIKSTIDLLQRHSVDQITMSMIALEANMTRTSIYDFFPTIASIYSEIAERYATELAESVNAFVVARHPETLEQLVDSFIEGIAQYFNNHIAVMKIHLGGSSTFSLPVVVENYDIAGAAMYYRVFKPDWDIKPLSEEDPFRTLVLLQTALLSASVQRHGKITAAMVDQMKLVARAYLAHYSNSIRPWSERVRDDKQSDLRPSGRKPAPRKQLERRLHDLLGSLDDRALEVAIAQVDALAKLSR